MAVFEPIFENLNRHQARYVVVGGLAVVLHGHARLTADVDLVVDFTPGQLERTLTALSELGLRARAPVELLDFASPERRTAWIREKGMRVFSLWDPKNPMREVDLFVDPPISFDGLWARSRVVKLPKVTVRIAGIDDLIAMKRLAGRPEDLSDIAARRDSAETGMTRRAADDWGTWEDNQRRKHANALDWSPAQRLAWLEEAIAVAWQSGALPRRRPQQESGPRSQDETSRSG